MTVSEQIAKDEWEMPSGTTMVPFNFRLDDPAHLDVYQDGTEISSYTCPSYGGGGGYIILDAATSETHIFTLVRKQPIEQEVDYDPYGPFPAESTEAAMDRLAMMIQEQQVEIDQALRLNHGVLGQSMVMPDPDPYKFLRWSSGGTRILNSDYGEDDIETIITEAGNSAAAAAASAAASAASAAAADVSEAAADASEAAALASENKAHDWAEEDQDVEVEPGEYSAHHWAIVANSAANNITPQRYTALSTADQTAINPGFSMDAVQKNAIVFLDGVRQVVDIDFTIGASIITLLNPIPAGIRIVVESTTATAGATPPYAIEAGDVDTTYAPDNYALDTGETKTVDQHLAGIDAQVGILDSLKNKIINPCFRVAQRGISFSGVSTFYTLDHWEAYGSGATIDVDLLNAGSTFNALYPDLPYYIRITNADTAEDGWRMRAPIEDVWTLSGKRCTLSFAIQGDAGMNMTVRLQQDFGSGGSASVEPLSQAIVLDGNWQQFEFSFDMPNVYGQTLGDKHQLVVDWMVTDTTMGAFRIGASQLEEGPVATKFQMRPYANELALCQRYYQKESIAYRTMIQVNGTTAGDKFYGVYTFPTQMRGVPAVNALSVAEGGTGFQGITINDIVFDREGEIGFRWSVDAVNTTTIRQAAYLQWEADAEL